MIVCGDSTNVMPGIPDGLVDLVVTDPPYGIAFMGRSWDKAVPSVDIWRECLRVLKPGGFAFVMCIPRQDCLARMIVNLEDAGFEVGFTSLYWAYASGFPKAANMSKMVDKRLGAEREVVGQIVRGDVEKAKHTGTTFAAAKANRNNQAIFGYGVENITTPATPEAKALDGSYSGAQFKPAVECVIVAQKPDTRKYKRSDVYALVNGRYDYWYTAHTVVTKDNKDKLEKKWGVVLEKGDVIERRLALIPELDDQVVLNRDKILWSRAYKDSDLTSTVTAALDNQKGITWLDDGRIPYEGRDPNERGDRGLGRSRGGYQDVYVGGKLRQDLGERHQHSGRFPANLLISDDVVDDGRVIDGGKFKGATQRPRKAYFDGLGQQQGASTAPDSYGDSGGFSRYFSLDAWWQNLPESVQRTFPFLVVPKAAKKEKNLGCEGLEEKQMYKCDGSWASLEIFGTTDGGRKPRTNNHPTVKPLKLMSYLITLGSRPGDLILDPFAGTCTTGMAAKMLGRKYLMIEIGEEWCQIGRRRIDAIEQTQFVAT